MAGFSEQLEKEKVPQKITTLINPGKGENVR